MSSLLILVVFALLTLPTAIFVRLIENPEEMKRAERLVDRVMGEHGKGLPPVEDLDADDLTAEQADALLEEEMTLEEFDRKLKGKTGGHDSNRKSIKKVKEKSGENILEGLIELTSKGEVKWETASLIKEEAAYIANFTMEGEDYFCTLWKEDETEFKIKLSKSDSDKSFEFGAAPKEPLFEPFAELFNRASEYEETKMGSEELEEIASDFKLGAEIK